MKLLATLDFENIQSTTYEFEKRSTVRAVMVNEHSQIALIHATKQSYYKLPGGGIDTGESLHEALVRECMEETGYRVRIIREIGEVVEVRRSIQRIQSSSGFIVRTEGLSKGLTLSAEEADAGFEVVWLPPQHALVAIRDNKSGRVFARFVVARDGAILTEALLYL